MEYTRHVAKLETSCQVRAIRRFVPAGDTACLVTIAGGAHEEVFERFAWRGPAARTLRSYPKLCIIIPMPPRAIECDSRFFLWHLLHISMEIFVRGLAMFGLLAAFFVHAFAQAGCADTLRGQNLKREIVISDCDHPVMMILTADFSLTADGGVPRPPVPFSSQCTLNSSGMECRRKGITPLAGSIFHYTNDTNPSCQGNRPGRRLTCVKGCSAEIPKYFYIQPWEC